MSDVDPKKQGATASQPSPGRLGSRPSLERLLRSAAQAREDVPVGAPFGFDTRIVALWRSGLPNGNRGLARFVQRVAALAVAVIVVSSAAAFYEAKQDSESDEPFENEFAIADSAIAAELPQ